MKYEVIYMPQVIKTLEKMDRYTKTIIVHWIEKNLIGTENPRQFGKPLRGNKSDQWRYRVGDYRILAKIEDGKLIILIIKIGHRRGVYK